MLVNEKAAGYSKVVRARKRRSAPFSERPLELPQQSRKRPRTFQI